MKILVIGIGAIGGWLASGLAKAEADVTLLARGENYKALKANGLTILENGVKTVYPLPVIDTLKGKFDCIIVATKTHDNEGLLTSLNPHLTENALLITAQNGLPHWFLAEQNIASPLTLKAQDVAGVVHGSTSLIAAGVVEIHRVVQIILGTPQGAMPAKLKSLSALFHKGGITAPISNSIRIDIWSKLWGNMSMNPVTALTRLSKNPLFDEPNSLGVLKTMMNEFVLLGNAMNIKLPLTTEQRLAGAAKLGNFKTSTMKDAEAGKFMEIDGLLGELLRIAKEKGVEMPVSSVVFALCMGLNKSFTG